MLEEVAKSKCLRMQLSDFLDFDAITTNCRPATRARCSSNSRTGRRSASSVDPAASPGQRQPSASSSARPDLARESPFRTERSRASAGSTDCSRELAEPIDYKAIDGRPVDLVFLLLSPANAGAEHLKALAAISRVTRECPTLEKMRGARSRDALAAVLMGADERDAA